MSYHNNERTGDANGPALEIELAEMLHHALQAQEHCSALGRPSQGDGTMIDGDFNLIAVVADWLEIAVKKGLLCKGKLA